MQTSVTVIPSQNEEQAKKNLTKLIAKKKKQLLLLTQRYKQLKIDLQMIQEEYTLRIGRLYIKDNLLDLEIIRQKKINELMACGLTYDEAVLELEANDQVERHRLEEEKEKMDQEYFVWEQASKEVKAEQEDIRNVWKKLVHKFHPDLAISKEDRQNREVLMKQINKAYSENDFNTLKTIEEKELFVEDVQEATLARLEKTYVDIENAVIRIKKNYQELRTSEWFSWRKKTKAEKDALFALLEKNMLDDIARKELLLKSLKKKYHTE